MTTVLFLLRAAILILLWGFVVAAIVAVRHDVFGTRRTARPAGTAATPPPTARRDRQQPRRQPRKSAAPQRLVVLDGNLAGSQFPLGTTAITIGRADSSTVTLTDDYVSTHHARLVPRDGAWVLEDLGSTNGTYVDRQRVSGPTPVTVGVPIRVGKTMLELRP